MAEWERGAIAAHEDEIEADFERHCNCFDPENCTQAVPGFICKAGRTIWQDAHCAHGIPINSPSACPACHTHSGEGKHE
jgi:hypothetical protein